MELYGYENNSMKSYKISFTIVHEALCSVSEIIDNYIDYSHEVWWHSKAKKQWWRKFNFAQPTIISPNHHRNIITIKLFGIIKIKQSQDIVFDKINGTIISS